MIKEVEYMSYQGHDGVYIFKGESILENQHILWKHDRKSSYFHFREGKRTRSSHPCQSRGEIVVMHVDAFLIYKF